MNRTVLAIGLASLLSDVGHEMATTALPAFLAVLGAGAGTLGLVEGLADGLASLAKLTSGALVDRLPKRKPLAVAGYAVTVMAMASFAVATRAWHVALGRAVGWLGRGARSPVRKVLLAEATTPETRGRAFGLERSMDSAGAAIGPLIAAGIASMGGMRATFALTIIPGALAAVALAWGVREKPHVPRPRAPGRPLIDLAAMPHAYRKLLVGIGVAGLGDFSKTLLILFATEAWVPRFGAVRAATLAMAFYAGYNVVYTASCSVAGALADRFPHRRVLAAGYVLFVVPALALAWPGASIAKFVVAFAGSGLAMGFGETVESTAAAELLPDEVRGTGFGLLATVNGIGDFVSSLVVGALWGVGPVWAMAFVGATSFAGALVVL